jgi:hypothetical protein
MVVMVNASFPGENGRDGSTGAVSPKANEKWLKKAADQLPPAVPIAATLKCIL